MEPAGEMTGSKLLKRWWPGTELNRRRQPFQGCSHPSLSGGNPYLYRRSYPIFAGLIGPITDPTIRPNADTGVRRDSDRANGSLVANRLYPALRFVSPRLPL